MKLVISVSGPVALNVIDDQTCQLDTRDSSRSSLKVERAVSQKGSCGDCGGKRGGRMLTLLWCLLCAVGLWMLLAWLKYGAAGPFSCKRYMF